MKISRRSPLTGEINERDLPITQEQFAAGMTRRQNGALIQEAFPTLSADDREFILTGYTPEDWAVMFPKGDA